MVLGDIIWGTSAYSKVCLDLCEKFKQAGCAVAHTPMARALRGWSTGMQDILIYPAGDDPFSEDVVVNNYTDFKADLLISVKDVWVFNHVYKMAIEWSPVVPIDHSPVSGAIIQRLETAFKPIAISRFGQRELQAKGKKSFYIPHCVDTQTFRPLEGRKGDCKKMFFMDPDAFVVGVVALNRSRKMITRMLRGFKRFLDNNPDVKAHMILWTNVYPHSMPGQTDIDEQQSSGIVDVGVNLLPEMMALDLGSKVNYPDQDVIRFGIPTWTGDSGAWDLVKLYNAMDCLLLCSGGEGFGMPLIESQSCGVPAITTNYAAGPELIGAGEIVKSDDYINIITSGDRYALANIDDMSRAMTDIYNTDREALAKKARRFSLMYDKQYVYNKYAKPFVDECASELKPLLSRGGTANW